MNRFGVVLLWFGALLGATKLALVASGGLMTAGAVVIRLGHRDEARALKTGADTEDTQRFMPPGT